MRFTYYHYRLIQWNTLCKITYKLTPKVATATELPANWMKNYTYFPIIHVKQLDQHFAVINAKTDLPFFSFTDTLGSEAVQLSPFHLVLVRLDSRKPIFGACEQKGTDQLARRV